MARVSTKENKNIYQLTRESLKLTRESASELLETISPERIEKIENERSLPYPDEVLDRKSTRLNSSHPSRSRMPSSA